MCSTVARIFSISSAFVAKLAIFWEPLPLLTLGIPSIVAACLAFLLTETTNVELPQTIEEAANMDNIAKGTVKSYNSHCLSILDCYIYVVVSINIA